MYEQFRNWKLSKNQKMVDFSKFGIQGRRRRRVERVWKSVALLLFIVMIIEFKFKYKRKSKFVFNF
jgi:hypothetical protein